MRNQTYYQLNTKINNIFFNFVNVIKNHASDTLLIQKNEFMRSNKIPEEIVVIT